MRNIFLTKEEKKMCNINKRKKLRTNYGFNNQQTLGNKGKDGRVEQKTTLV